MKKIIIVLCLLTLVFSTFQDSLVVYAEFVLPTPTNKWVRTWDQASGSNTLRLQNPSNPEEYPYAFPGLPATGAGILSSYDDRISDSVTVVRATQTIPPLYALIARQRTTSSLPSLIDLDGGTISPDVLGREYVESICFESDDSNRPPNYRRIAYTGDTLGVPITETEKEYYCLSAANQLEINSSDAWVSSTMEQFTTNEINRSIIQAAWISIREGQNFIYEAGRGTGDQPLLENVEACSTNHTRPLLAGATIQNTLDNFEQFTEEVGAELETLPENSEAIRYFSAYFNDEGKIRELLTYLTDNDLRLYNQYYGQDGTPYPTITPSDELYQSFIGLFHDLQESVPMENPEAFWNRTTIEYIRTEGIDANVVGYGMGGLLGGFLLKTVQAGLDRQVTSWAIDVSIKKLLIYKLAMTYALSNERFNECLAEKGDPYARPNEKFREMVQALYQSALDIGSGVQSGAAEGPCGKASGGAFSVDGMMRNAFCVMAVAINDWANGLFLNAVKTMQASLGVNDPTERNTGSSTTSSSGLTPEEETELKNQAEELCQTTLSGLEYVASISTLEVEGDPNNWTTGPCLLEKINGYEVDITNNPEQDVDRQEANMCTGDKIVKLTHACEFVSISSQTSESP